MSDALINANEEEAAGGTRPDALVFAWLLELPDGIDSAEAARAVLFTLRSSTPRRLSRRQREIVAELQKIVRLGGSRYTPRRSAVDLASRVPTLGAQRRGQGRGALRRKPKLKLIAGGQIETLRRPGREPREALTEDEA